MINTVNTIINTADCREMRVRQAELEAIDSVGEIKSVLLVPSSCGPDRIVDNRLVADDVVMENASRKILSFYNFNLGWK